jgi:signal peptidase I
MTKLISSAIAIVVIILVIMKIFFIDYYHIPQNGMYPNLPAGSRFFAWKRPYPDAADVARGDVIVFRRNENGQSYLYIWRVIGLPGDMVQASGDLLAVNGKSAQRQRIDRVDGKVLFREQIGRASYDIAFDETPQRRPPDISVTVPADQFFVMGDNRFDARDSRYFGTVPFVSIIAKKL